MAGKLLTIMICTICLVSPFSRADNARDWQNLPEDLNLFFAYYSRGDASSHVNTPLPFDGVNTTADLFILRYAHTFDIDGRSSGIQIIQPYADISISLDDATRFTGTKSDHSPGDTQIVFIHNLIGGPSMSMEEFNHWAPEPFITSALWITLPTGSYDRHRSINVGANRWAFRPEFAMGYPVDSFWLELNTWAILYTDNNQYQDNKTLSQRPLYTAEGHISYTFSPALWVSADSTWTGGGETKVDGDMKDNQQQSTTLGTTAGFMLTPQFGGMISWSKTVAYRHDTTPDMSNWTFRLQYAW